MATQTLSALDAVFKNAYRGVPVELLNQDTYLIDQLEKTNANDLGTFTGRQLIFLTHVSRNRGRGAITDGGTLATAGGQGYLDGIVAIKYYNEAIELTDMVIEQAKTDEGAFIRTLSNEMDRAGNDLRKDISRMTYGTGDGLLATITATPSGTSITVDSGQFIAVGDTIDILVKSTGATTNGVVGTTVTAVSLGGTAASSTQANATLTISPGVAGALSTSYGVYLAGDRNNESDGLRNITNTSRILHNINSSTSSVWDGNVDSSPNYANPSEDLFMKQAQRILGRNGRTNGKIDTILTTLGVQRRLANTYASQKRWNDAGAVNVAGGYSAIMVSAGGNPTPVIADTDCPNGFAFELNKGSFAWAELAPAGWLTPPEGGGGMLWLKDGSTAGTKQTIWQGWMRWYATLVCVAPGRNGQISTIADDVPLPRL